MTVIGEQARTTLHFSTGQLPPAKRLPALRDLFDRAVQLEIDTAPGHEVEMTMAVLPGLRRARMLSSLTARMTRPAPMLADGEDTVCLLIKTGGHLALTQRQREGVPDVGDGVLLVYREPASLQFVEASYLSVRVPFSALALAHNVSAAAAQRIPRDNEALSLLRAYVAHLPDPIADPQLARLYATHVHDLMALAIGSTEEGRQIANQRGVRAARREAIKAELTRDPGIRLDRLAARHGISPRYVQMLFEEAGITFSGFVLERRLEAARSMLASPRYGSWSITAIALEAGFGDVSYFNRRFKQRFLMTPTDARVRSGRDG
jgi:AraC-like DNA-binding protein